MKMHGPKNKIMSANVYGLLFVPTTAHIRTVQHYITNTPTSFGASSPSSGRFGIVFVKVTKRH